MKFIIILSILFSINIFSEDYQSIDFTGADDPIMRVYYFDIESDAIYSGALSRYIFYKATERTTNKLAFVKSNSMLNINYNEDRLKRIGLSGYKDLESLELYYRYSEADPQLSKIYLHIQTPFRSSFWRASTKLHIPNNVDLLQFWFRITDKRGNVYWDSKNGNNYFVKVISPNCSSRIMFKAPVNNKWIDPYTTRNIEAGNVFCVNYEPARLYVLGGRDFYKYGTKIEASLKVYIKFLDEKEKEIMTISRPYFNPKGELLLYAPAKARKVLLWFRIFEGYTNWPLAWDDNFGNYFVFEVN